MSRHETDHRTNAAVRELHDLAKAALTSPILPTEPDLAGSGIPEERQAEVLRTLRALRERYQNAGEGAGRSDVLRQVNREARAAASDWVASWGRAYLTASERGEVPSAQTLLDAMPRSGGF
jgi:hypothetical protein